MRVEETWEMLGQKIRPLRDEVFVRTDTPPEEIMTPGGILLATKWQDFYKGWPHQKLIRATVCSAGPRVKSLKPGDVILFQRLFFARHSRLEDGSICGWIKEPNVIGYVGEEDWIPPAFEFERKTPHSMATTGDSQG